MARNTSQRDATNPTLKPQQELALGALLAGENVTDAADAAGVDRTTLHRWLREDMTFCAELNRYRAALRRMTMGRLLQLVPKAVDVLDRALDEADTRTAVQVLRLAQALDDGPLEATSAGIERIVASPELREWCRSKPS